jgi:hypothetical protein
VGDLARESHSLAAYKACAHVARPNPPARPFVRVINSEQTMAAFDYRIPAELFPNKCGAGLPPTNGRKLSQQPVGYGRFAHAAYAIRFAIEELSSELLPDACLQSNDELFDHDGIRRLYDSEEYPLVRHTAPFGRINRSNIRFRT